MGWTRYAVALYLKGFPGAAGPQFFLRTVEDLPWLLLIRPREHFECLFAHLPKPSAHPPAGSIDILGSALAGRFVDQNSPWLSCASRRFGRWNNRSATLESPLPQRYGQPSPDRLASGRCERIRETARLMAADAQN